MSDKLKKTLIGAIVAVALAAAVSYGLISQETADQLKAETDKTLSEQPAQPPQQPAPAPQDGDAQQPAPAPRP